MRAITKIKFVNTFFIIFFGIITMGYLLFIISNDYKSLYHIQKYEFAQIGSIMIEGYFSGILSKRPLLNRNYRMMSKTEIERYFIKQSTSLPMNYYMQLFTRNRTRYIEDSWSKYIILQKLLNSVDKIMSSPDGIIDSFLMTDDGFIPYHQKNLVNGPSKNLKENSRNWEISLKKDSKLWTGLILNKVSDHFNNNNSKVPYLYEDEITKNKYWLMAHKVFFMDNEVSNFFGYYVVAYPYINKSTDYYYLDLFYTLIIILCINSMALTSVNSRTIIYFLGIK